MWLSLWGLDGGSEVNASGSYSACAARAALHNPVDSCVGFVKRCTARLWVSLVPDVCSLGVRNVGTGGAQTSMFSEKDTCTTWLSAFAKLHLHIDKEATCCVSLGVHRSV